MPALHLLSFPFSQVHTKTVISYLCVTMSLQNKQQSQKDNAKQWKCKQRLLEKHWFITSIYCIWLTNVQYCYKHASLFNIVTTNNVHVFDALLYNIMGIYQNTTTSCACGCGLAKRKHLWWSTTVVQSQSWRIASEINDTLLTGSPVVWLQGEDAHHRQDGRKGILSAP